MPDYVRADITIGGELTIHQIGVIAKKLFEIDRYNDVSYTFGGLLQQIEETGEIFYEDDQAERGEFQDLEDYLRSQGIWYDRDSNMNQDPYIAYFRGTDGLDELQFDYYDGGGDVIVTTDHIIEARDIIKDVSDEAAKEMDAVVKLTTSTIVRTEQWTDDLINKLFALVRKYAVMTKELRDNFDEVLVTYDLPELPDVTVIDPVKHGKLTQDELEQLRVKGAQNE